MYLLQKVKLAWTQYRSFQQSLAELKGYSDRELSDLGFARADIVRTAYEDAERHVEAYAPHRHAGGVALATAI